MVKSRFYMSGAVSAVSILIASVLIIVPFQSQTKDVKASSPIWQNQASEQEFPEYSGYKKVLQSITISESDIQGQSLSPELKNVLINLAKQAKSFGANFYVYDSNGNIYNKEGVLLEFNVKELNREYYNATFREDKQFYVSRPFTSAVTGRTVLGVVYKGSENIAILASVQKEQVLKAQVVLLF